MLKSSLIYIESNGEYLMLHRISKHNDPNKDKWLGVGGKFEEGETPYECAAREMKEETGLTQTGLLYRGIVDFHCPGMPDEEMHLFTCASYEGELIDCDEGRLEWVEKNKVMKLNLWEGDRVFLKLLAEDAPFFKLSLIYDGERLTEAILNGEKLL